jgi:hypothetical protein
VRHGANKADIHLVKALARLVPMVVQRIAAKKYMIVL